MKNQVFQQQNFMDMESEVSIYKRANDKFNPKYSQVDKVLDSIKKCSVQAQIDLIRNCTDSKQKRKLKEQLPSICFSGKFNERVDAGLIQHSGLAVLDFDHCENVKSRKDDFKKYPFVYSAFFSPSGDGVKVLVRIPPIKERHEGYYYGLIKLFPTLDTTSRNVSRVCFASCDSEIYINENAIEFTDYVDISTPEPVVKKIINHGTDYFRISVAAKIIRESVNGTKHHALLKASKLLGGYIASGNVDETDAIYALESEISKKEIDDFEQAKKTIRDGIEYGKRTPIFESQEFKQYAPKNNYSSVSATSPIEPVVEINDFVATAKDTDDYIEQVRNDTFKMGLTTMFPKLDEHWRFKPANLVVINGHDNTGKSVVAWYLATLSALFHGWRWIIYSNENKTGGVKKKIIEFYRCKSIKLFSEDELTEAKKWFDNHFTILKNTSLFTYKDMISIGQKLNSQNKYDAFLIDPYNSLWAETKDRHEYDYKAMTEFRQFITQTGCGIYLNCHAVTEALRRKYPKEHPYAGFPMPPDKADTEGGGKFSNKADDFITIHRLVQHPQDWMYTEIHIKKIKEMETGGKHTFLDEPVKLRMLPGSCGFEDINGFNPITNTTSKQENLFERISESKEKPTNFHEISDPPF